MVVLKVLLALLTTLASIGFLREVIELIKSKKWDYAVVQIILGTLLITILSYIIITL